MILANRLVPFIATALLASGTVLPADLACQPINPFEQSSVVSYRLLAYEKVPTAEVPEIRAALVQFGPVEIETLGATSSIFLGRFESAELAEEEFTRLINEEGLLLVRVDAAEPLPMMRVCIGLFVDRGAAEARLQEAEAEEGLLNVAIRERNGVYMLLAGEVFSEPVAAHEAMGHMRNAGITDLSLVMIEHEIGTQAASPTARTVASLQ